MTAHGRLTLCACAVGLAVCWGASPLAQGGRGSGGTGLSEPVATGNRGPSGLGRPAGARDIRVLIRRLASAGSTVVLSLRTLSYTPERWGQFWSKVDRWGFPVAA